MSGRMTHHAGGLVAGLAVGQVGHMAGWPLAESVGFAAVAALTGGGEFSPDFDQRKWARSLDRWLPDELLGAGGPLQHRGISHWPGVPVLALVAWHALLAAAPVLSPVTWLGWAIATGWFSHLLLDATYGHAVHSPEGLLIVRAGVPTMPWWRHRGGVWTSSGPGSQFAGVLLGVVACGQLYLLATGGGGA